MLELSKLEIKDMLMYFIKNTKKKNMQSMSESQWLRKKHLLAKLLSLTILY